MPVQLRGAVLKGTQVNSASPLALFAAGEQGVWFDPSDMSTMFQDAAGTTPVTAMEQPVGLILDKSKELVLGPELITNGNFNEGTTGWTLNGTATISFGTAKNLGANDYISQGFTTVVGRSYILTYKFVTGNSGNSVLRIGSSPNSFSIFNGASIDNTRRIFVATSTTTWITFFQASFTSEYDNISVREIAGNHAFQSTSASRPVLSARYNLLNQTETFDDVVWVKGGSGTITSSPGNLAPNGTLTADIWSQPAPTSPYLAQTPITVFTNTQFVASISIKKISGSWVRLFVGDSATLGAVNAFSCAFNLDSVTTGTPFTVGAGSTVGQCTITPEANGYYRIKVIGSLGSTSSVGFGLYLSDGDTLNRSSSSSCYIWGADLRVANDGVNLPPYQRVNTSTDYDTAGFPPYLRFDGVDDSLSTASINFTATDKITTFVGLRKLVDPATGASVIAETSADPNINNGQFSIVGVSRFDSPATLYGVSSKGTIMRGVSTTLSVYNAPVSNILTGLFDISGDKCGLRINSVDISTNTSDQGTGNYGNYPLYIGSRGGTILFFNGHLYSLIVRGATTTAAQINAIETWTNLKTRAY